MTKKRKPSKPLAGAPSLKVDLDPIGEDATTYVLVGDARVKGKGADHEDLLRRLNHFLNHPTATRLMAACGISGFGFRAKGYAVLDEERGRMLTESKPSRLLHPYTGRPIGD